MSLKIKTGVMKVNDDGTMKNLDMLVGDTSANIEAINSAGTQKLTAIETKGNEILNSIPEDYTELTESVNTLNESYEDLADDVSELKEDLVNLYDSTELEFEQGWVNSSTGENASNTNRCRTVKTLLPKGESIVIKGNDMQYNVATWTGTTYNGLMSATWISDDGTVLKYTEDRYIVVGVRQSDNANITPANVVSIVCYLEPKTKNLEKLINNNSAKINSVDSDVKEIAYQINYFNKDSDGIITNKYIGRSDYIDRNGYYVSHPIKVLDGVKYGFTISPSLGTNKHLAYSNSNGIIEEVFDYTTDNNIAWFTSNRNGYVVVNLGTSYSNMMFCKYDEYPSEYAPYGKLLADSIKKDLLSNPLYGKKNMLRW